MTGPATLLLNLWLAGALDRGLDGLRLEVARAPRDDADKRLRGLEEQYRDWPHLLEVKRAQAVRARTTDSKRDDDWWALQVQQRLPSGEWEHVFGPCPTFRDTMVREIMSLAPAGRCVITRSGGQPPLSVNMRRSDDDAVVLEIVWEEATP